MKRIELFGASGVGKTTLMETVKDELPEGCLGSVDLDPEIDEMQKMVGLNTLGSMVDSSPLGSFLDECISRVSLVDASASQKILALNMLNTTLRRHSLLSFLDVGSKWIVDDEHLLHRVFAVFCHSKKIQEDFEWYYKTVDLPSCAIYCQARPEVVMKRVLERRKIVSSYRYESRESIFKILVELESVYQLSLSILKERDCKVYTLDLNDDVEIAKKQFLEILYKCVQE